MSQGKIEPLKLPEALTHVLDECRMVLPGIQALFGFQMIAVFNTGFAEKLTPGEQKLHVASILLVVLAMALVMTPASIHRRVEPKAASERFLRVSSRLLLSALVPLALGICLDVLLVTQVVWRDRIVAVVVSFILLLVIISLWIVYPFIYGRRRS